jgi:glucosamine kinase
VSVVGIDIGGSKTHGLRVLDGRVVAEAFTGSANVSSVGPVEAARQLESLAERLGQVGTMGLDSVLDSVTAVCAGAAGVDSLPAELRLRQIVEDAFPGAAVRVVHDTQLVLAAAGLGEGIVLISGTGSAAWGRNTAGEQARASGWGYLLGDDGSGFGVMRAATRHTLDRADAGLEPDPLATEVLRSTGADGAGGLLEAFYRRPSRREWAARSSLVFSVAERGDPAALAVVDAAAAELVLAVTRVRHRLGISGPVVLAGGLLVHQPLLREKVRDALLADAPAEIRVLEGDPVHGAVALAGQIAAVEEREPR